MTDAMAVRWVVRRTVYLLIGGAVVVAFLMLAALLLSPGEGAAASDLRVPGALALVLMVAVGLLPGIREVQVAAAQTLLGTDQVSVPEPMRWEHRWRTALWTFVHQVIGILAALAVAVPVLVVGGIVAFAGGAESIDVLGRIERPVTAGGWILLVGAAAVAVLAVIVIVVGGGVGARWAAPSCSGAAAPTGSQPPNGDCGANRSTAGSRTTFTTASGMR